MKINNVTINFKTRIQKASEPGNTTVYVMGCLAETEEILRKIESGKFDTGEE